MFLIPFFLFSRRLPRLPRPTLFPLEDVRPLHIVNFVHAIQSIVPASVVLRCINTEKKEQEEKEFLR